MRYLRVVAVIAGLILLASACGGGGEAVTLHFETARGVGTLNIDMDDFKFTPDNIKLTTGQQVRIVLSNSSATNDHGFTVGYGLMTEGGASTGFQTDLFDGVEVTVSGPAKLVRSGKAIVTRDGDGEVEDDASGFLVIKGPSSQATLIEFTVPDTFGEFEFASFESNGEHYKDGMKGLINVFPKDADCPRPGTANCGR
jgi:plastocyanin